MTWPSLLVLYKSLSILYIVIRYYDMCFLGVQQGTRARLEWETEDKSVGPATTTARYLLYEMAHGGGPAIVVYSSLAVCAVNPKRQDTSPKSCLAD